ncbi:MAG: hypothetical protein A3D56_03960 [Candidatus Taylorbacteria bacterium RIFCSPHIGHO2_02_FULL_45_35]|uniref:Uncharacterized protein n=1 Tax=Candidatus Taylorbacteria bacterium RIFCSPHIGHO2_02_FULL_45_35 TaxID=1802311 RepID=A0A1G2MU40_9BACT|nr:MAG: hypothetical protein A3D56_03960 [Candidatus Taylorbacteria bacterium RIFCSPHIGHO2_02_FULL_45_35]
MSLLLFGNLGRRDWRRTEKIFTRKFRVFKKKQANVVNPIRYPRFRVSASGVRQSIAFAFGVPLDINGFHPYT